MYNTAQVDRNSSQDRAVYNAVEVSFQARIRNGSTVFGGWTAERNVSTFCEADDDPNGISTPAIPTDLYIGEQIGTGGRFCDQSAFAVPLHAARCHASLEGHTPQTFASRHMMPPADLSQVRWVSHCRNLVQLPLNGRVDR